MAVRAVLTIAAGCCLFLGGLAAAALCLDPQFAAVNAKALLSCSLWALGLLWLRRGMDRWVGAGEARRPRLGGDGGAITMGFDNDAWVGHRGIISDDWVNPATGLPMSGGMEDVLGHPYGSL